MLCLNFCLPRLERLCFFYCRPRVLFVQHGRIGSEDAQHEIEVACGSRQPVAFLAFRCLPLDVQVKRAVRVVLERSRVASYRGAFTCCLREKKLGVVDVDRPESRSRRKLCFGKMQLVAGGCLVASAGVSAICFSKATACGKSASPFTSTRPMSQTVFAGAAITGVFAGACPFQCGPTTK